MLFLFFTFLLTAFGSIQDCNTSSILQLTKLDLVPASPSPGQPLAMTVQFNNPGSVITSGTVTTTLTYNFIPFAPTTEALCTNTACPLVTGFNDRSTANPWRVNVKNGSANETEDCNECEWNQEPCW